MDKTWTAVFCLFAFAATPLYAAETPAPVTIRVVDGSSGEPVKQFTYEYGIDSPDRHDYPTYKEDVKAKTEDGVIRIPAPRRCSLWICASTPRHMPRNCAEFKVLPDDQKRTFTLELTPGATVRGVVVDDKTGKPIARAKVSPRYFGHPLIWISHERGVRTDADGRFQLAGVDDDFGICVEHPRYKTLGDVFTFSSPVKIEAGDERITIRLNAKTPAATSAAPVAKEVKPRLFGRVVDFKGNPVGPYRIVAAAMPGPDVAFGNKAYWFEEEAKDVPQGKPWELTLYSDRELYWVMAEAPGLAPAVQVVWHKDIDQPIELRLHPGFSLSGKVEGPGVEAGKAVAMVQPMYLFDSNPAIEHHHESPLYRIQVSRVGLGADGRFRIADLAPGSYILQIVAPGATPIERLVTFRDKDIRLESPLKMVPSGRIEGIVFDRDGKPMVMESCHWSPTVTVDPKVGEAFWGKYSYVGGVVSFTTDENSRFVLENAPAGRNSVGFSYNVLIDVIDSYDHLVNVLPGRTTEVRINVPEDSKLCWKLPVEVTVGNGSRQDVIAGCCISSPGFFNPPSCNDPEVLGIALALKPLGEQAVSWPAEDSSMFVEIPPKGGPGRAVLRGIHPGKYRVSNSVLRWNRCCDLGEPFVCRQVDISPGANEPLRIQLPAASVQVDYQHPREDATQWGVLLMALDEGGKPVRQEFVGYGNNLYRAAAHLRPCLDFVPPGRYTLLAWRDGLGWARSQPIDVEAGKIADAGTLRFQPGGTIRGRIAFPELTSLPQAVAAIDSNGVRIAADTKWTHEGYTFVIKDLWPGKWTVAVFDTDQNVLIQKHVELKGTEEVQIE